MTPTRTLAEVLESELFKAIARAGSIERGELAYQMRRKRLRLDERELEDLIEEGHVREDTEDLFTVVIPGPRQRAGGGGETGSNGFDDEEILDRLRLWALVVGRPPSQRDWHISKVRKTLAATRVRLEHQERVIALYESGDWPATTTVKNRFGSMNAALLAAGFGARGAGGQPGIRRIPTKPRYGAEPLAEAFERTREARASEDDQDLHDALIELAIAAFNEADSIEEWDPS